MQTTKTSVHGAINMLGLAKRLQRKILQASTSEVYGDPDVHPQTEDYWGNVNPIGPRSCYDEGKRCAETLFFDYQRQHRLRIKVARIFNTYGPRMHPNDGRVVSNFIVQALRGQDDHHLRRRRQTRSFCYVDDLIEGFVRLMATPDEVTGPINLGNPDEFTIARTGADGDRLTGSRSKIVHRPLPEDDPRQRRPDISKAREDRWAGGRTSRCATGWPGPSPISKVCFRKAACRGRRPADANTDAVRPECADTVGRARPETSSAVQFDDRFQADLLRLLAWRRDVRRFRPRPAARRRAGPADRIGLPRPVGGARASPGDLWWWRTRRAAMP